MATTPATGSGLALDLYGAVWRGAMGAEAKAPDGLVGLGARYREAGYASRQVDQAGRPDARGEYQALPLGTSLCGRLRPKAPIPWCHGSPKGIWSMLERTTPGCGPCPACRAKGLPWHPNGQWSWNEQTPDQLTCNICKTVFPNEEFPR